MVYPYNMVLCSCKKEWGESLCINMQWFLGGVLSEKSKVQKGMYSMLPSFCVRKKRKLENAHISAYLYKNKHRKTNQKTVKLGTYIGDGHRGAQCKRKWHFSEYTFFRVFTWKHVNILHIFKDTLN